MVMAEIAFSPCCMRMRSGGAAEAVPFQIVFVRQDPGRLAQNPLLPMNDLECR
jgi:hypothetical protein